MYTLLPFVVISFWFSNPIHASASSLIFQELNKFTTPISAADDRFGIRVATTGDTEVVGSYGEYATIFELNLTTGLFEQRAILTVLAGELYDSFGDTAAISSETVIVGAYNDDCPSGDSGSQCGSVYLFEKPVSGWFTTATPNTKLTAFDDDSSLYFGYSLAVSGDTVVAGTPYDNSDTYIGSAYLFVKPAFGWNNATQTSKLITSDAVPNNLFGGSVAISGNTAVVGAIMGKNGAGIYSGSADIFEGKHVFSWPMFMLATTGKD